IDMEQSGQKKRGDGCKLSLMRLYLSLGNQPDFLKGGGLPLFQFRCIEAVDQFMKLPVPVHFRLQV
ncbi:MAG TPA: hypothetical protein DCG04_04065, partial [Rhodospirillaceae bacterium]|nr:hypothetical protein [Rhodospirillaceae bacterium]